MANYKVIFRDDQGVGGNLGWEAGCPILVETVQVARNIGTGECWLQLKISNVSGEVVERFTLEAEVSYHDDSAEMLELRPLDADIAPDGVFRCDPVLLAGSDVEGVRARIVDAVFGGTLWVSCDALSSIPQGSPLDLGAEATNERANLFQKLGKSSMSYKTKVLEGDGWWVCPCGTPNVARETCWKCGLSKTTLKRLEDENGLRERANARATSKRGKKKAARVICAIVAAIALIVAASFLIYSFVVQPELDRQAAEEAAQRDEERKQSWEQQWQEQQRSWEQRRQEQEQGKEQRSRVADEYFANSNYEAAAEAYRNLGMKDEMLEAMYCYVQAHRDKDDEVTQSYLEELVGAGYEDSAEIESSLNKITLECSLCDPEAYTEDSKEWVPNSSTIRDKGNSTSPILLMRAEGGRPGTVVEVKVEWEKSKARTQLFYKKGVFESDSVRTYEVPNDGTVTVSGLRDPYYCEAWRAKVIDIKSGETLFTGEIRRDY